MNLVALIRGAFRVPILSTGLQFEEHHTYANSHPRHIELFRPVAEERMKTTVEYSGHSP